MKDKYSATWVSHTSISDFLNCPRAYYLKNVYKDPKTNHKLKIMSPPMSLGQAVHEVIESLSIIPTDKRFLKPLTEKYENVWKKLSGKMGGFQSESEEKRFKERGRKMLVRLQDSPGPLMNLAVKINMDLPFYWLSEKDNIILCGKIDWLEFLQKKDSVHIIDFKTSKTDVDPKSLQLPIYCLLAQNTQKRKVEKVSFWYIERNAKPTKQPLPDLKRAKTKLLKIAREIKLARSLERFPCKHKTGCRACRPYEKILRGEAEFVGVNEFKQDVYIIPENQIKSKDNEAQIL